MTDYSGFRDSVRRNTRKALLAMVVTIAAFVLPTAVATPAQAVTIAQLNTWVNGQDGLCTYGTQCVSLINGYAGFAGVSSISGNAVNFYANANGTWIKYALGAHTPVKGDVVVYNANHSGNAYGHVALILENVSATQFRVFHQNYNGTCAHKEIISRTGISGYIRPTTLT
ncbi:MAG: CHAP domain-containing protein [Propionibacteriaceae bacterium]|jgi:hypothetical protein|nr:CHAP domain-containing protein [Propionibacteriaceae bacterium]